MSRRKTRRNAVSLLYTYLITDKSIDDIIEDNRVSAITGDFMALLEVDEELLDAVYRVEEREDIYVAVINKYLTKGWKFSRLGRMEQAILLLALAELEQGIQDKPVIVNEAVELAKEFGDEDSFRLINGVLDVL